MNRLLIAVAVTLPIVKTPMNQPLHAQTPSSAAATKKSVVFACRLTALTTSQRRRQLEVLSPAIKSARLHTTEMQDGYAFGFPSDAKTFAAVFEWVGNERLCCPFFEFDLHVGEKSLPMTLRITGPQGVKQFIEAELPEMVN